MSPYAQIPFTMQEVPYYQQLLEIADHDKKQYIDGNSGAQFLMLSGLPEHILRNIWNIADCNNQGWLVREDLFAALRLVAHAQAGRQPCPELVMTEPPALPEFEGLQRKRTDSELSPRSGHGPPSVVGNTSEVSEMQPVIAETEKEVRRAAEYVRSASPAPTTRGFDRSRWAPSQREKRKYASLFLRMDWNKSGFIEGSEATQLLERARLDNQILGLAWEHADKDHDGRLTFPEFVCLIHIISCIKKGAPMPSLQEGLPPELFNVLANLNETPEELNAQRSRSPSPKLLSRSEVGSPDFYSRNVSPSPAGGDWLQPPTDEFATARNREDPFGTGNDPTSDFGMQQTSDFGLQQPEGFGESFGDEFGSKKDKKEKKHKKDKVADGFDAGENLDTFASDGLGAFGDAFETRPSGLDRADREREISKACEHFNAVIEADKAVSRQLRSEVDKLEDEHRQLRDEQNHFSEQVRRERQQCEQMSAEKQRLEHQLQEVKNRLDVLRDHRRAVDLESISLRRDREMFSDELSFLQRMAKEEEITLECLRNTNADLERSYIGIEGQNESLEKERRHLVEQVSEERRLVQLEERQNAEIRTRVERLRRELGSEQQSRREEFEREKRREEMQRGIDTSTALDSRHLPSSARVTAAGTYTGHSWAGIIASEAIPASGMGSSQVVQSRPQPMPQSARQLLTTGPANRQGV